MAIDHRSMLTSPGKHAVLFDFSENIPHVYTNESFMVEVTAFHGGMCTEGFHKQLICNCFTVVHESNVAGHPGYILIVGEVMLVLLLLCLTVFSY